MIFMICVVNTQEKPFLTVALKADKLDFDDMGIEPFLISSSILLTCAQRLVRRVCPNCREEFVPEPELLQKLDISDADSSTVFGDGGGMTVFEVKRQNDEWGVVGPYRNVDFSTVGNTFNNCGGAQTPFGRVLTAEEFAPGSNTELYNGGRRVRDTSDVTITIDGQQKTLKRYQNMGWMVEVDPINATRKIYTRRATFALAVG